MGSFKVEYEDVKDFLKELSNQTGIETTFSDDKKGAVGRSFCNVVGKAQCFLGGLVGAFSRIQVQSKM